jgi:hypothetical protein
VPTTTDSALWEAVARIPLEPLLPNRSLQGRLRALLTDCAGPIREQVRAQADRPQRPPPPLPMDESPAADAQSPFGAESANGGSSAPGASPLPPPTGWPGRGDGS